MTGWGDGIYWVSHWAMMDAAEGRKILVAAEAHQGWNAAAIIGIISLGENHVATTKRYIIFIHIVVIILVLPRKWKDTLLNILELTTLVWKDA
jgi:hypothetical protein